jgi:hypothetical protein
LQSDCTLNVSSPGSATTGTPCRRPSRRLRLAAALSAPQIPATTSLGRCGCCSAAFSASCCLCCCHRCHCRCCCACSAAPSPHLRRRQLQSCSQGTGLSADQPALGDCLPAVALGYTKTIKLSVNQCKCPSCSMTALQMLPPLPLPMPQNILFANAEWVSPTDMGHAHCLQLSIEAAAFNASSAQHESADQHTALSAQYTTSVPLAHRVLESVKGVTEAPNPVYCTT